MNLLGRIFRRRKSLSGYLIVRNAVSQGYPFLEAITSVLAQCSEFLVLDGFSTDETWEGLLMLRSRYPGKMRLFREEWEGSTQGGEILARMSNHLRDKCKGDFCLNLQANEIMPEESAIDLTRHLNEFSNVDLFRFPFVTYMGPDLVWMEQYRTRLFRNQPAIISLGDAFDVGPRPDLPEEERRRLRWRQIPLRAPIRRYRGLFPVNYLRKLEGRLALFQTDSARYFTEKERTYGQRALASLEPKRDSPRLFWEKMKYYLEEEMWRDNPSGWEPESGTVRLTKGFVATQFAPIGHLTHGWSYNFAESCRQLN